MTAPRPVGLMRDVSLAPKTTFGLGGPARAYVEVRSDADLLAALAWAKSERLPVFVLGGGSNVLAADEGFPGLVIAVRTRGIELGAADPRDGARVQVRAFAGEPWDAFVEHVIGYGLSGLECLSGIPGVVGSTPIQNVGAYGQEVESTLLEVAVLDRDTLERRALTPAQCRFGYRHSIFKEPAGARWIVTSVTFSLSRERPAPVRYGELAKALADHPRAPDARTIREAVLGLRRAKSMVYDPDDPNHRSAGSFFTNPIVARATADRLIDDAIATGTVRFREEVPVFAAPDGDDGGARVKLSAGWLIERAGFARGLRRGNVGLSTKHALCLVHHGGGRAQELLALAREIVGGVEARFGVRLVPEPVLLGFSESI